MTSTAPVTSTAGDTPPKQTVPRPTNRLRLARLRDLALIPPIIALLVYGYTLKPDLFLTKAYLVDTVLKYQSELALIVLAEALVLIVGKFDLSLESIVGIAPAIAVFMVVGNTDFLGAPWPTWTVLPVALLFGALIGAFNGLLIVRFKLSAFIVTLAMLIALRGLQLAIVGGATMSNLANQVPVVDYLGSLRVLTLPISIWIVIVCFGLGIVVLGYTRVGRSLYAVGGNPAAARAAGIRVERVIWITLVVAGVLAAFAGLMLSARLGSVAANQGSGMIFTVFAAAVIGGISLDGGKGSLFGALTGVVLLGLIQNVLTLAQVKADQIQAVNGLVILVALVLARLTSGKAQD
ncbi:ribose/xylose/arabinose/galactoside ABC-type transport system permease subunit [Saccharothrix ecbatanensis]|uniref:Ribose/xylose/arabinose/galactoside ABC-type transport system permease subunit n=1 Tax=Saccharothrix ecbatanensis TaxID=1105145 RepID=A0A7W9HGJ1_9PSEU|nr:ABC transporter permease [Saccharothrix ecbatanensis]MBB5801795.1 ribose/xylose/arabinose/galactoside ABC-type transport system permease subunit [Saccharothrix ecbatanensis]